MTRDRARAYTYSEQFRHECEVRYVVALPTRQQRLDFLAAVEKRRGEAAARRLRDDVQQAWAAAAPWARGKDGAGAESDPA